MARVDVGGTEVAYRRFGSGPAVILVHGWPLSGITWRHLVAQLRRRFTCIVPDLPGSGSTPWSSSIGETFADLSELVRRFADAIGLRRFALIGQDSGGAIARTVAAAVPERITALAMTNTELPGHTPKLVRAFQRLTALPGSDALFGTLLRSETYCRSRFGFGGCFLDGDLVMDEFHAACIAPLVDDPSGATAALRAADFGYVHRLASIHERIRAPVLCVWGEHDPFFPVAGAEQMVHAWGGRARLEVIPGKLFVHEERADDVAARFESFLAEHTDASGVGRQSAG